MNKSTSKVDMKLKLKNQELIKERIDAELHNHHKTELVVEEKQPEYYK